jgi:hypothetical protein
MSYSCPVREHCYCKDIDCLILFRKNCIHYEQVLEMMEYEKRTTQRRSQDQDRLDLETIRLQIERAGI